jgi:hypothetical protein
MGSDWFCFEVTEIYCRPCRTVDCHNRLIARLRHIRMWSNSYIRPYKHKSSPHTYQLRVTVWLRCGHDRSSSCSRFHVHYLMETGLLCIQGDGILTLIRRRTMTISGHSGDLSSMWLCQPRSPAAFHESSCHRDIGDTFRYSAFGSCNNLVFRVCSGSVSLRAYRALEPDKNDLMTRRRHIRVSLSDIKALKFGRSSCDFKGMNVCQRN